MDFQMADLRVGRPANKLDNETVEISNVSDDIEESERLLTQEDFAEGLEHQEQYGEGDLIRRQDLELRLVSAEDEKGVQETLNHFAFVPQPIARVRRSRTYLLSDTELQDSAPRTRA